MSSLTVNQIFNSAGTEVYTAKAWVNFNGTGTVAIRASGNVSSITDNGVGLYTVNFTTAMPDASYSTCVTSSYPGTGVPAFGIARTTSTVSAATLAVLDKDGFGADVTIVNVAIFR